jgi:hypothetical protein
VRTNPGTDKTPSRRGSEHKHETTPHHTKGKKKKPVFFFFFFSLFRSHSLNSHSFQSVSSEGWYSESVGAASGVGCSSWTLLASKAAFVRAQPLSCFSGSACWATGNGSIGYSASEDSVLGARLPFDFSAFAGPAFFSAQISVDTLASRDGLFLEWSSDGGNVWRSTGGFQYDSSALVGSRLEPAFGGLSRNWRLVSGTIDGVQGLASVLFRFRFRASGSSGARGGVLVDDIIVSKSALPACPTVTAPDNGQTVNPVPFVIQWSPSGAAYYDLELRQGGNVTVVGVGVGSQWQSPAMPVGLYEYSIRAREPDNTTNPFCQRRSINVAFVDYVRVFPFEAGFEGSENGFRNVDYDSGRFIAGPVPANKQFAAPPSGAAAYTSGTLQRRVVVCLRDAVLQHVTLLPAAIFVV